jgi:alkaline phosphatase
MENGAIGVQIDGSKASTLLARAQKERGAFGSI